MAAYDEDIAKNPFFVALEKLRPDLCARVAQLHGIVLVPRRESLDGSVVSELRFESYVLQPAADAYQTADGKEVRIQDRQVLFGSGPPPVPILFEETFYNDKEESYSILCVSEPVETARRGPRPADAVPAAYRLRSLEEVKEFLGRHSHKLDKLIASFCLAFKEHDRKGLRHHIDSAHGLYTRCLQCVLRDARPKVLAKQELQMSLLKQAVEVYVHHGIHSLIFNVVATLEAGQDAAFNKMTRSLHELQHEDVGVKAHFSINLSRAKRELSQLNRQTSPLLKLLCLRGVALAATRAPSSAASVEAVSADDLLPVVVYLLVKMEIPNWMANLSYVRNFCFSQSAKDELSYCLSTFEAAVEYISRGKLRRTPAGCHEVTDKVRMGANVAGASTAIGRLFEHVADGKEAEVERLLSPKPRQEDVRPCHPLCSCHLCDLQLSGKLNDPSVVTASSRDRRGYTPLHVAAICGQAQLIDLLMSKGASANATDYHALTPLHLACQKGYQGVTLLLLHYQADADARDNNGNTPLHLACTYGHEDCVKALVYYDSQRCCLDAGNDKGDTPLHLASRWGYEAIVRVLLENGASVRALNNDVRTPAHCALNSKVLTLLRKKEEQQQSCRNGGGAQVPRRTSERGARRSSTSSGASSSPGREPPADRAAPQHRQVEKLLRAVADADVQMVRYLLEWTDEDEASDSSQASLCHPLCQCAACAPAHKTRAAPCGASCVNSADADGVTPLHVSCTHGHAELTSLLLRRGAEVDARTDRKATPLHLASQNDHSQVVKLLLECNAKLNKKDGYGNTALIHACLHGNLDTAAALIQSEALVNARNRQGSTALHCAVRAGHRALVEMLLQAGASPHLRDKKQRTPLDAAYQRGGKNAEIVRALQKAAGLSPDAEPIKPLSVPKGALAHSLVQRLRLNDPARHKSDAGGRTQQMKESSRSPGRRWAAAEQKSPDASRRRLRRGGAQDAAQDAEATPRSRGRGPSRRRTPDSGEEAPEPPINVRMWSISGRDDLSATPFVMTSSLSEGRTPRVASTDDVCRHAPRIRDATVSSRAAAIGDHGSLLPGGTFNSGDTPRVQDTAPHGDTSDTRDQARAADTCRSSPIAYILDTHDVKDASLTREIVFSRQKPRMRNAAVFSDAPHIEDATFCRDMSLIKDASPTCEIVFPGENHNSGQTPRIQNPAVSIDTPHVKDITFCRDMSHFKDASLTPATVISGENPDSKGPKALIQNAAVSRDAACIKDTIAETDAPLCQDMFHIKDTLHSWEPDSSDISAIPYVDSPDDAHLIKDAAPEADAPVCHDVSQFAKYLPSKTRPFSVTRPPSKTQP